MSFFNDKNESRRYINNRPYFHPLVIQHLIKTLDITEKFPLALDIACGPGQSSTALLSISKRVIGFDISWNMLATAERNEGIRRVQAQAEAMPFRNSSVPIMSCALAIHWFVRDQFFSEAWRVLNDEGILIIYNNGFKGIMRENTSFTDWGSQVYGKRFPVPPRDSRPLTRKAVRQLGFELFKEESYENEIVFTPEKLVAYLTTQTNVVAAIQQGRETLESASIWLINQVRPFFMDDRAKFVFGTRAWYLKKRRE